LPNACAPNSTCGPPLEPWLCHQKPSFRHAFTLAYLRSLDSETYQLFAGAPGPHAAHRLLQSCDPRAHLRFHQTPKRNSRRRTVPRLGSATLASDSSRAFTGQGLATRVENPHRDDRSPQRIYPNLFDPDTSCRKLVPDSPWIEKPSCRAVYGLSRTNSPGSPRFHATYLVGPPPTLPRERSHIRPHPRCLPPSALFNDNSMKSGHHVPVRSPCRDHSSPTPFLPPRVPALTRPFSRWLDRPISSGGYRLPS
jgi:hypothetical protein